MERGLDVDYNERRDLGNSEKLDFNLRIISGNSRAIYCFNLNIFTRHLQLIFYFFTFYSVVTRYSLATSFHLLSFTSIKKHNNIFGRRIFFEIVIYI